MLAAPCNLSNLHGLIEGEFLVRESMMLPSIEERVSPRLRFAYN
jgi:hypothetical protein